MGLTLVASGLGLGAALAARVARAPRPEPGELTEAPLEDTFGTGPGVTWEHADAKVFSFAFASPTPALGVLRYRAVGQVTVGLNGAELGAASADRDGVVERVLPARLLRRLERNEVTFAGAREPWRVGEVSVELWPLPDLPPDALASAGKELARHGRRLFEHRDASPENLFHAWRSYRSAWLTLEALEPRTDLHLVVTGELRRAERELDRACRRLLMSAQRAAAQQDPRRARQVREEIRRYFPTAEHRCHNQALGTLKRWNL